MQIPKLGTKLKPYVVKAGQLAEKYGKEAAAFAAKYGKKGFIRSVEAAEKAAAYYAKSPKLRAAVEEVGMKIPQALLHAPKDDASKQAHMEAQMRAKIMKEMQGTVPMPSSTIQQPQAPMPQQLTLNPQQMAGMSREELEALAGRRFGGPALPKAQYGDIPLPAQTFNNPAYTKAYAGNMLDEQDSMYNNLVDPSGFLANQQVGQDPTFPTIQLSQDDLINNSPDEQQALIDAAQRKAVTESAMKKARAKLANKKGSSSKSATPSAADIAEAEAEIAATNTDTPAKKEGKRGNYEDTEKKDTSDTSSTSDDTYNTIGGYRGFNGRRKTKMWAIDPETGKRKLVFKNKQSGPGAGYGFDRRNNSRKNIYNIYNNMGAVTQQKEVDTNGNVVVNDNQLDPNNANVPSVDSNGNAIPNWVNDPFTVNNPNAMEPGTGVMAQIPSPYRRDFDPYAAPDPAGNVAYDPRTNGELDARDQRQLRRLDKAAGILPDDWRSARRDERRDERQAMWQEARDNTKAAKLTRRNNRGKNFDEIVTQPVPEYTNYFYRNGGGYNPNDPTGMLPKAQYGPPNEDPYGTLQTPEGGQWAGVPEVGTQAYANATGEMQQVGQVKDKFNQGDNNIGQWAPMILPAMDMISSAFESRDAKKNEEKLQKMKNADNIFSVNNQTNRGKNTVNQGYFDPANMVPTQFAGNNQGSPGSYDTFAQKGLNVQNNPAQTGPGGYGTMGEYQMASPEEQAQWRAWAISQQPNQVAGQGPYQQQMNSLRNAMPQQQVIDPFQNVQFMQQQQQRQLGGGVYMSDEEIQQVMAAGGQVQYL
jgi:hypothetical protein